MQLHLIKVLILNNIILLCIYTVYIYYLVSRKNLARDLGKVKDEQIAKLLNIGIGIGLLYAFWTITLPSVRDIPYLVNNDLYVITGNAEGNSVQSNRGTRQVCVKDATEESVLITIYSKCGNISRGDELTIVYLPYTHYGVVVEHVPAD